MVFCSFCKKNGECEEFYNSHKLKDENGMVTCPILKKYTCPRCKKVGEHTVSYCSKKKRVNYKKKNININNNNHLNNNNSMIDSDNNNNNISKIYNNDNNNIQNIRVLTVAEYFQLLNAILNFSLD